MSDKTSDHEERSLIQIATSKGKAIQVGRDYTHTQTFNIWIPIFLIVVAMLGGLMYWGISVLNQGGVGNQVNPPEELQTPDSEGETNPIELVQ